MDWHIDSNITFMSISFFDMYYYTKSIINIRLNKKYHKGEACLSKAETNSYVPGPGLFCIFVN
jgi:hypothetical protein